jgi:hypothetical protein
MSFLSRLFPGILHGSPQPFPMGTVTSNFNATKSTVAAQTLGTLIAIVLPCMHHIHTIIVTTCSDALLS